MKCTSDIQHQYTETKDKGNQQMARRRVRWDRLIITGLILFALIFMLYSCLNKGSSDSDNTQHTTAAPTQTTQPAKNFTVTLDAGHGGSDAGCHNADKTRLEKDDNLKITLAIQQELQKFPNVTVLMTRTDDSFVSLEKRCEIANEGKSDLFISFHRNSATEGNGVEIWINENSETGDALLASNILAALDRVGVTKNRGAKEGYRDNDGKNYYVNRNTDMPSCLAELGFLSYEEDNVYFDNNQAAYAKEIAQAIIDTGKQLNLYKDSSAPAPSEPTTTEGTT